jgi:diguanylate cyclase (GGDEF)-like protein
MLKKSTKSRMSQNEEANFLLRIITLIAGVFTIIIVALLLLIYTNDVFATFIKGIVFTMLYLSIFVLTFVSDFVKRKATVILYNIYYISSIYLLYTLYKVFDEIMLKLLLLVTFAVILGFRKMVHLVTYNILMFIAIVLVFILTGNNVVNTSINIAIFSMFFLLAYVNLRSKLSTEKALIYAEESIKQMAYYDALTGLPNRYKLNSYVHDMLNKTNGNCEVFAVVFIDLDNFKNINDSLGHSFGDRTLIQAAKILSNCVREDDIVSRYGGDEFVIILKNINEDEMLLNIHRIINEFNKPFLIEGHEIYATTSIGISLYPLDGSTVDTLIMNADAAMYKAKSNGKSNFSFFADELNKTITRRMELESGLRRALEREEFYLCYQPQVYLESGQLWGMEALIRWNHPVLGIISPLEFIPIAEDTSLIISIGEWVLETACKQNKIWQEEGLDIVPIAVNVSAIQLKQSDFVGTVKRCIDNAKLDSKYIVVELTESIIQDRDRTFEVVNNLKSLGIKVAIDDFGTGYSSLSLLKNLNIDILKIDSYFIKDIDTNSNTLSIIKLIVEMGNSLKFSTIVEGIESQEQSRIIGESGCKLGQGYLFSKPVSVEEVKKYMEVSSDL